VAHDALHSAAGATLEVLFASIYVSGNSSFGRDVLTRVNTAAVKKGQQIHQVVVCQSHR
jgi:hypothetical protein